MDKTLDELIGILAERGISLPKGAVRIGSFGDSESLSDSLIELMLAGAKRATCSLLWSYEFNNEVVPEEGDIEIVLDWHGRPSLVRRITEVEIVPFDCVTADFAASEGEGDRTLKQWQEEHWRFFTDECKQIGRTVSTTMLLVCERFEVLSVIR